jgi:hypothetical protein
MKAIKVTYRATFRQPIGKLNPGGFKFNSDVDVEVFESKAGQWSTRRPGTTSVFKEIPTSVSSEGEKALAGSMFNEVVREWRMFYQDKALNAAEVKLQPDGRILMFEPDDFTHIGHPDGAGTDKKKARAACGVSFEYSRFASALENAPPPTCAICAAALKAMRHQEGNTAA